MLSLIRGGGEVVMHRCLGREGSWVETYGVGVLRQLEVQYAENCLRGIEVSLLITFIGLGCDGEKVV